MKKIVLIGGAVIISLGVIGAGTGYFGLLWSIHKAEVKILQQLNALPQLKVESLKINLEEKGLRLNQVTVQHERIKLIFPEINISTDLGISSVLQGLRSEKVQDLHLHVTVPEFQIEEIKASSKAAWKDLKGHLETDVKINREKYQFTINSLKVDDLIEGSGELHLIGQPMNLRLSKQIQQDLSLLVKKNIQSWEKIKLVSFKGQAINHGLGAEICKMAQIEPNKASQLLQTGIQLLSTGDLSTGEKLSRDVLSSAYYFLNSTSPVGFELHPPKAISTNQILTNLQTKLDLGVLDLGAKLWVKQ